MGDGANSAATQGPMRAVVQDTYGSADVLRALALSPLVRQRLTVFIAKQRSSDLARVRVSRQTDTPQ